MMGRIVGGRIPSFVSQCAFRFSYPVHGFVFAVCLLCMFDVLESDAKTD